MQLRDIKNIILLNYIGQFRRAVRNKQYLSSTLPADREGAHKRRARMKNAIGSFSNTELEALYCSVNGLCYWCGNSTKYKVWHADHYVPIALGGPNCIENIVISCQKCNNKKGAKDPLVFAEEINKTESRTKRNLIFQITKINPKEYQKELIKAAEKSLIITIGYLDKINAYAFMFSNYHAQVMSAFSEYYKRQPKNMKFNKYNTAPGQNIWLIHEKLFDKILTTLSLLDDKTIKLKFIQIRLMRTQAKPKSEKFITPSFKPRIGLLS